MTALLRSDLDFAVPTFSFVIPAYNEADDIGDTLDAVWAQLQPAHEVIVVDDGSTDGTPEMLRELKRTGGDLTLIEHAENRGIAAARNSGSRVARGDVLVFLDADDQPDPDFLQRLTFIYQQGVDCVCVESRVAHDDLIGRYIQAEHEVFYAEGKWVGFSAGFSCRRELVLDVLFPEELGGAEEVVFFRQLVERGVWCETDFSIVIARRFPTTIRGFWKQWVARARPVPYVCLFIKGRRNSVVVGRRVLVTGRALALMLAILPAAVAAVRRARKSPRKLRDLPAFWFLYHVQLVARRTGEWQGVLRILSSGRGSRASQGVLSRSG